MFSYFGLCPDGRESLILFEAVKRGIIPTVSDRLSEEERKQIRSGSIYIWDERQSPMRRWTDGRTWSNSRVVGDFLEYRESIPDVNSKAGKYTIKPYGLRKRTICSPAAENSSLRLIAYFTSGDAKAGALKLPSQDPLFAEIVKDFNTNPSSLSNLQLLAGMRKRKRLKSAPNLNEENEGELRKLITLYPPILLKTSADEPTDPSRDIVVQNESRSPTSLESPMFNDAAKSMRPYGMMRTAFGSSSVPNSPTSSKFSLDIPQLPSPIWCPHNMHGEDIRALSLLDSHDAKTRHNSH